MANLRPFQIFMLAFFGILAVVAVVLLSGFQPNSEAELQKYGERVVVWGPFDQDLFDAYLMEIEDEDKGFGVVTYTEVNPRSFNSIFINAIAEGNPPDLVLMPAAALVEHRSKLQAIPYETISERDFRDRYVDGAEIFARPEGIYALPALVDPMLLYWNRDLFAASGLAQAPTTWEYIVSTVVPSITRRDNSRNILLSAIAFGEHRNVTHAKEILLLLLMQSGSQLIFESEGRYHVELNTSVDSTSRPPLEAALQFYTNFSTVNNSLYSWNRSQQLDRNAFVAEELAMYFGLGSESMGILRQNPNLNFDVAPIPQGSSATAQRTYGDFYGYVIPRTARNSQGAFGVASVLASPKYAHRLSELLGMSPVARNAVAAGTADAFREVLLNSSLIARGWLDPNQEATDDIFEDMIEDITSGRENVNRAAAEAERKVELAF